MMCKVTKKLSKTRNVLPKDIYKTRNFIIIYGISNEESP